jgi:hypothetical protein
LSFVSVSYSAFRFFRSSLAYPTEDFPGAEERGIGQNFRFQFSLDAKVHMIASAVNVRATVGFTDN